MKNNPYFTETMILLSQRDNIYRLCPDNWGKVVQDTRFVAFAPELYDYLSKEHGIEFKEGEKKEMFRLAKEKFNAVAPHFGNDSYDFLIREGMKVPGKKDREKIKEEAKVKTKELVDKEVIKWYKSFLVRKFLLDKLVTENLRWDLVDQFGDKLQKVEI